MRILGIDPGLKLTGYGIMRLLARIPDAHLDKAFIPVWAIALAFGFAATVGLVPIYNMDINHQLGDTNKLHEYLMGGLPVVASDLPEIRRIVTMGDPPVGELFDPSSPDSIAAALHKVLDDPEMCANRRRQARKLAEEHLNWGIEERRLLALYENLMDGRPS